MKRPFLTASLVGSAAAGLLAITTPAWAQATTYPQGTDCSAIQNSASRTDCLNQMNESRQNTDPAVNPNNPAQPGLSPDAQGTPATGGAVQPDATGNAPAGGSTTGTGTGSSGSSGGSTQ